MLFFAIEERCPDRISSFPNPMGSAESNRDEPREGDNDKTIRGQQRSAHVGNPTVRPVYVLRPVEGSTVHDALPGGDCVQPLTVREKVQRTSNFPTFLFNQWLGESLPRKKLRPAWQQT